MCLERSPTGPAETRLCRIDGPAPGAFQRLELGLRLLLFLLYAVRRQNRLINVLPLEMNVSCGLIRGGAPTRKNFQNGFLDPGSCKFCEA